jgi:hypothetical protein
MFCCQLRADYESNLVLGPGFGLALASFFLLLIAALLEAVVLIQALKEDSSNDTGIAYEAAPDA